MAEVPQSTRDPGQPLVFMRFRPMWAYIDGIRDFCQFFCSTTFPKSVAGERVQLAIQELLENAIKYSSEHDICDVELQLERQENDFVIAVANYASAEGAQRLLEELDRLQQMTPEEAYTFAMRRAARSGAGKNQLGLSRLRHEAQVEITASRGGDGRIHVVARGRL